MTITSTLFVSVNLSWKMTMGCTYEATNAWWRTESAVSVVCLILINERLSFSRLITHRTNLIEHIGIKLYPNNKGAPIHFILIYLPGQSTDMDINRHFKKDLNALGNGLRKMYIMGDFNARNTNWNCPTNNRAGILLQQYVNSSNNFIVAPADHTHCPVSGTIRPSTIDLLVTDGVLNQSTLRVINKFDSDHLPVYYEIYVKYDFYNPVNVPCYRLANWKRFRERLNEELGPLSTSRSLTSTSEIDRCLEKITNCIKSAANQSIPTRLTNKDNIVIDDELKSLIDSRNYHRRRFNRNHDIYDRTQFHLLNQVIRERINELKFTNWNTKLSACTNKK